MVICILKSERGDFMSLGQRLIELRKMKKLSQEEMAEKLNVTRQTISKWETDQSTPDFDKIIPLCKLFEITTDELLTGKKVSNENNINGKTENVKKKRVLGIIGAILLYFIALGWIMISIPVLNINPIVASALFLLLSGIATCIIIYSLVMFKPNDVKKETTLYKRIKNVVTIIVFIIYLLISFGTKSWHITWFIWLIYLLILEIIKLIMTLRGDNHEI